MTAPSPAPPLRVWYDLTLAPGEDAERKARAVALEQTVELPEDLVPPGVPAGRVAEVAPLGPGRFRAAVDLPAELAAAGPGALLTLLWGNVSMQSGVRVAAVEWPDALLGRPGPGPHFGPRFGPRFGIGGVRAACGAVERRALLATALKPVGASPRELAERCHRFALGGIDLIKDDHGLADPASAPFRERVQRCQEAVARANDRKGEAGGFSLYLPHLTGSPAVLAERLEIARAAGCRGVLAAPLAVGLDALGWIGDAGLFVLAHPALSGAFLHADHGLAPALLLGQLFRLAGADGVIYPQAGGRFALPAETCAAIEDALRAPLGALRPAFPVPAGGLELARVPHWLERLGPDTILLIGSSLYRQPDWTEAARRLAELVRAPARSPEEAAK